MKRNLNEIESAKVGEAVEKVIYVFERVIAGDYSFSKEQTDIIGDALLYLYENYNEEELMELFVLGLGRKGAK